MIVWATEIKLRAERRAGELLDELAKLGQRHTQRKGGSTVSARSDTVPTLEKLGITRDQASDWQKLAALPEREFERRLAYQRLGCAACRSGELRRVMGASRSLARLLG
jgi:hypothetical protein